MTLILVASSATIIVVSKAELLPTHVLRTPVYSTLTTTNQLISES